MIRGRPYPGRRIIILQQQAEVETLTVADEKKRACRVMPSTVRCGAFTCTPRVPLERLDTWMEPALVSEWIRLMKARAEGQGRTLDDGPGTRCIACPTLPRRSSCAELVNSLFRSGADVFCVWTGKKLTEQGLDIDHCLPGFAWPCDDLWNSMPAQRSVSQRQKRNRRPSDERLSR